MHCVPCIAGCNLTVTILLGLALACIQPGPRSSTLQLPTAALEQVLRHRHHYHQQQQNRTNQPQQQQAARLAARSPEHGILKKQEETQEQLVKQEQKLSSTVQQQGPSQPQAPKRPGSIAQTLTHAEAVGTPPAVMQVNASSWFQAQPAPHNSSSSNKHVQRQY
jgi:hypothetical protein